MIIRSIAALLSLTFVLAVTDRGWCLPSANEQPSAAVCSAGGRSIFDSRPGYLGPPAPPRPATLKLGGMRLETLPVSPPAFAGRHAAPVQPKTLGSGRATIAIISSAIIPGAGEAILYSASREIGTLVRAPVFLTFDILFWYGYHTNHTDGKDVKQQYMDFADAHWTEARFLAQHPCCVDVGGCESWQEYNELGASGRCSAETQNFFLYTPRELDVEEYYENLGKYNAFVYGWDDWTGQADFWTPNRTFYWNLRSESDKYLLRGDQFIMLLIVNRVVSVIDTAWLAYRMRKAAPTHDTGWSIELEPGFTAPSLTIGYRF
jgi:hypothetical protein